MKLSFSVLKMDRSYFDEIMMLYGTGEITFLVIAREYLFFKKMKLSFFEKKLLSYDAGERFFFFVSGECPWYSLPTASYITIHGLHVRNSYL